KDRINRLRKAGILKFKDVVTKDQIIKLFDEKVASFLKSDEFRLKVIQIDRSRIQINGERHLSRSVSVGPVIVDAGGNDKIFVVDGKHRILDTIERGDKFIE